jgi:hypothetical protein
LDFGFWILDFGFWILDFGFWILDFGLRKGCDKQIPLDLPNLQFRLLSIQNPKSKIQNQQGLEILSTWA